MIISMDEPIRSKSIWQWNRIQSYQLYAQSLFDIGTESKALKFWQCFGHKQKKKLAWSVSCQLIITLVYTLLQVWMPPRDWTKKGTGHCSFFFFFFGFFQRTKQKTLGLLVTAGYRPTRVGFHGYTHKPILLHDWAGLVLTKHLAISW